MRLGRVSLLPADAAARGWRRVPARLALPVAAPNDNRTPAGTLRDGVLTISLEATLAMWHPDGDSLPGMPVEAFAESGKQPSAPGPLVRVPAGTEIRVSVRNALERDTLTFYVPAQNRGRGAGGAALDSVVLAPGEVARAPRARGAARQLPVSRERARSASTARSACAACSPARSSSIPRAARSADRIASSCS